MIKNLLLDWAGTVMDEAKLAHMTSVLIFKNNGLEPPNLEDFKKEFFLPYMDYYRKHIPNITKEECNNAYLEIMENNKSKPFSGVVQILERLQKKGIQMAVLSSNVKIDIEEKMKMYNLSRFFKIVRGGVLDKETVIEQLLIELDFKPEETAFIA